MKKKRNSFKNKRFTVDFFEILKFILSLKNYVSISLIFNNNTFNLFASHTKFSNAFT